MALQSISKGKQAMENETDCRIEFQGKSFTACGSMMSQDGNLVMAYVGRILGPMRAEITKWNGEVITIARITGTAKGFHRTKLLCVSCSIDGSTYYGRGLGEGMLIRLRKAKR
jgi:hypothetical protein